VSQVANNELKKVVESLHGGTATYVQSVPCLQAPQRQDRLERRGYSVRLEDGPSGPTRAYVARHGTGNDDQPVEDDGTDKVPVDGEPFRSST
jgi:hypothetical protein